MSETDANKEQILVLHDGDLADTVRMLAGARMIRDHHKRARITLLCGPDFEALLKHCPYFNTVESSLQETARKNLFERFKAARASGFNMVYDLGSGEAGKRLRSGMRFSSTKWIDAAPDDPVRHPLDVMAEKLGAAGLGPVSYPYGAAPHPEADWIDFLSKRSRTLEPAYFGLQGPYALFAPAGDGVKPALRWPKERWASLAHALIERGVDPVIVGGPDTREIGRYVQHVTPGAKDLTGRANLVQLTGLGRRANFVFGEETELLHLLVAAGAPAVVFHPSDTPPVTTAPRGPAATVLMHAPTLAQISVGEAVQAMRFAGGFANEPQAA